MPDDNNDTDYGRLNRDQLRELLRNRDAALAAERARSTPPPRPAPAAGGQDQAIARLLAAQDKRLDRLEQLVERVAAPRDTSGAAFSLVAEILRQNGEDTRAALKRSSESAKALMEAYRNGRKDSWDEVTESLAEEREQTIAGVVDRGLQVVRGMMGGEE